MRTAAAQSIRLITEVPGPKSRALLARRVAAIPSGLGNSTEVGISHAHGALVTDVDGNQLIDMAGGIGMINVGHTPDAVVEAIRDQAGKLIHCSALVGSYEPYIELCEMLNAAAPGDMAKKTLLVNTGSEAVENAVNLARSFTGRQGVICFDGAYHGRTQLALSLTSKYSLFKKGFGPFCSEIYRFATPNLYRKPATMSDEQFIDWICAEFDNGLIARVDPSAVAAVIIEPVQGEAGFVPMPPRFLAHLRRRCDEHGIVFIADEIQSGMGRTGKLFSIEHTTVVPDVVVTAKSLGAGTPIAAVTGRSEIMDSTHRGGVGGTYGGSPLACRAAIEAVKQIQSPAFQQRAEVVGDRIAARLDTWKERFSLVGDVRGLGAMRLVEFVLDRQARTPAPEHTLRIIQRAVSGGLLLIRAGLYSNCIRLLPPIVITNEQLDEALDVLEAAIAEVDDAR
ncbi:aspartate aminotransferase family protein [Botrimarina hoheduenensis]|uniref:5-aminovalerate aminotransferase DavT n=1 Tax=Botrimarina hoheduenensis TaxID=2528000 RepID=A0A5C5W9V4_9BACT|nr:aminotransferase class III-fold pyridoxal phosphate-dependent enzyme [Botrimarina hoheduenensis]TWT47394.1 5-aminovalerate aminotransferase DavT [Botrimarina hoheduenensis]